MKITHYTIKEGGEWLKWPDWPEPQLDFWNRWSTVEFVLYPASKMRCKLVHALRFENGQEWDAVNGSRGNFRTYSV